MLNRREFLTSGAALTLAIRQKADAAPSAAVGEWRNKRSEIAYRQLGRTGFMVSEIVMGGNEITRENNDHVLAALDLGLNYLDTASQYGNGESERGYAQVIKARGRDSFFLNSKVSAWDGNRAKLYQRIFDSLPESEQKKLRHQVEEEASLRDVLHRDHIGMYNPGQPDQVRAAVLANIMSQKFGDKIDRQRHYYQHVIDSIEGSLQRLGTDHLDIMMCPHGASTPFELLHHQETFDAFEKLKKDGKVRHLGVSAHNDPAGILEAAAESGIYSVAMVAYNIVNHRWVDQALAKAKKAGVGVISMKSARPVHDPRRGRTVDPARVQLIRKAMPGPLKVPQKAYLWNLKNPNLSAAIANMSNMGQMRDDVSLARSKA